MRFHVRRGEIFGADLPGWSGWNLAGGAPAPLEAAPEAALDLDRAGVIGHDRSLLYQEPGAARESAFPDEIVDPGMVAARNHGLPGHFYPRQWESSGDMERFAGDAQGRLLAVSYTPLTLPTNREV